MRNEITIADTLPKRVRKKPDAWPVNMSHAHLSAILDTAVEGIIVIDERGRIETFNRAAQRMFGYRAAEAIGRNVSVLMPEPFRSGHDRYISGYLHTGKAKIIGFGREVVGLRKNGSTFPIELAISEVRVGKRRTFTGLVKDITERKRLEKEILDVSEQEQRRIGQDLHDGVCQELAGIAFTVQSTKQRHGSPSRADSSELSHVVMLLQNAIRRARRLSHGLLPVDPEPNGLRVALAQLAAHTADVSGSKCEFCCTSLVKVYDPSVATQLYRIAQDAVNEMMRQHHAARIIIDLSEKNDAVRLHVFSEGKHRSKVGRPLSMDLRIMRRRAQAIGATLRDGSTNSHGVQVFCEFARRGHMRGCDEKNQTSKHQ